ncbi:MAG: hypothetical protein IPP48_15120 [Chitinophagaceae bacterium]|nr:hypothetical protein [Chitinophagaceae bacterium]
MAVIDGMFILQGSDYVTIDGIDLQEAAANTTAATQMEVGYGLFKTSVTDGCQNVTIKNCAFSFGRASTINGASWTGSTAIASANAVWGAVSTLLIPTALSGTNSNNTFSYNTITGGSAGIQVIGYLLDLTNALCDQNNTISYNSVLDYGNATTNSVHGIIISGQVGFLVNNNIVASSSTSKHAGTINGIFNANGGVGGDGIISYNLVTVHGGGTTTHTQGIRVQSGTSTATITIANNKVYNSTHTTSTTGSFFGILVTGNAGTYNIINDTITNNNIVGSATYSGIISLISVTTGTPTNVNIMGNSITNNSNLNGTLITATGAVRVMDVSVGTNVLIRDNTIDGYTRQNSVSTSTVGNLAGIYCAGGGSAQCFVKHNTVNNIVYNGAGTGSPIVGIGTGASANLVVDSNTVTNLTNNKTTGTSIIYGIYDGSAVPIANYNYNVVSNLTSAGPTTIYGMNFATGAWYENGI